MRILTESHGSFPEVSDFAPGTPRIAFFNSDREGRFLMAAQPRENLLVLGVDDLDVELIPAWIRGLLVLPETLSYRVKRYAWQQAIGKGEQPSAPMAIGDAHRVLVFFNELQRTGADELVISCEYGKSRSVTLARFLEQHAGGQPSGEKVPNAWVDYLMGLAAKRQSMV